MQLPNGNSFFALPQSGQILEKVKKEIRLEDKIAFHFASGQKPLLLDDIYMILCYYYVREISNILVLEAWSWGWNISLRNDIQHSILNISLGNLFFFFQIDTFGMLRSK